MYIDKISDLEDAILLSRLPDEESARAPSPPAQPPQPQKPRCGGLITTRRSVVLAAIAYYIGAAVGIYYVDEMEELELLLVWIFMIPMTILCLFGGFILTHENVPKDTSLLGRCMIHFLTGGIYIASCVWIYMTQERSPTAAKGDFGMNMAGYWFFILPMGYFVLNLAVLLAVTVWNKQDDNTVPESRAGEACCFGLLVRTR